MAVHFFFRTVEVLAIETVDGYDDSVESGSEVADSEQPSEHGRGVETSQAESEDGEAAGYHWSNEYGDLKEFIIK